MTTSLLATLIFCGIILFSFGSVIYLSRRIKNRKRVFRRFYPVNRSMPLHTYFIGWLRTFR